MEPKEALSILDGRTSVVTNQAEQREWAARTEAIIALREKVAREEAAKPKRPTLKEMEARLRRDPCFHPFHQHRCGEIAVAAADILKTLRERGGEVVYRYDTGNGSWKQAIDLLRDLGVQPKEA